ncbi:class I SAM-dependent methyltransferase [Streptomyces sp. NPDC049099]|uniref:SAM-dependent methyltransferase n=1 Tax=Streptomyces sp. NPDC049099 TaxID=3155768 RepID=UPI003445B8A9
MDLAGHIAVGRTGELGALGSGRLPKPFNDHMHRVIEPALALPAGSAILDAGCGAGGVARWLAEQGAHHVLGADVELPLSAATGGPVPVHGGGTVELRRCDLLDLSTDRPYDAVLLLGVLHYAGSAEGVHRMLGAADRLAVPGAPLALSWICDEITLTYEEAFLPGRELVLGTLAALGREPVDLWARDVRHAHGGSPEHEHRIVYGVWRRAR